MHKLKEKIFGLIVIIALAVIFIPMLFNATSEHHQKLVPPIPIVPSVKTIPEVKPAEAKPAEVKPAEVKPAEVKPVEVKPEKSKEAKHIKEQVEKRGWVVQLGLFAMPVHTKTLIKKLKEAGYPAYTRQIHSQGQELTLVLVGPYVKKSDAKKLISTLEREFKLEGLMVHHEP